MGLSTEINLTLRELAQIALGGPQFTKVNLSILHALVDLILKKLNCGEEKVSIDGFEARCLEEIMATAKICPLPFNDERIELISSKIARLDELKRILSSLDTKVEQHLQDIHASSNGEEIRKKMSVFDLNPKGCEDLCTLSDPNNAIACKLLGNSDFLKKLLRRLSVPMIERICTFENQISELAIELSGLINRTKKQYEKIKLIEGCVLDMEAVKQHIREHEVQYGATLEEIQDMMDSKLDKFHLPPMKKYIRDCLDKIDSRLKAIEARIRCTRAAGVIVDVPYMPSGKKNKCADPESKPIKTFAGLRPCSQEAAQAGTDVSNLYRYCGCEKPAIESNALNLMERLENLNLKSVEVKVNQQNDKGCHLSGLNPKSIIGTNGNIYRAG